MKDGLAGAINDYTDHIEKSTILSEDYKHYNLSLINSDGIDHERVRRSPKTNFLRIMTFNVKNLAKTSNKRIKDIAKVSLQHLFL